MVHLAKKSGFLKPDDGKKMELRFGRALLRHMLQVNVNSQDILRKYLWKKWAKVNIAAAIHPISAWFNHSCDPNVERQHVLSPSVLIQRATKAIPAGMELLISYQAVSIDPERAKLLLSKYGFKCDCPLCVLEARDSVAEGSVYYPVSCDKCG